MLHNNSKLDYQRAEQVRDLTRNTSVPVTLLINVFGYVNELLIINYLIFKDEFL